MTINRIKDSLLPNTTYIYQDPRSLGYKRIKLTRKEIDEMMGFKTEKGYKYELFYKEGGAYIRRYKTLWCKIANLLLVPVSIVYHGAGNTKKVYRDTVKNTLQRKYGSFSEDRISPRTSYWGRVEKLVNSKGGKL